MFVGEAQLEIQADISQTPESTPVVQSVQGGLVFAEDCRSLDWTHTIHIL